MKKLSKNSMSQICGGKDIVTEHNNCLIMGFLGVVAGCVGTVSCVMGPATAGLGFVVGTALLGLGYSAYSMGDC